MGTIAAYQATGAIGAYQAEQSFELESGTLSFSGSDISMYKGYHMSIGSGTLSFSGSEIGLYCNRVMSLESGTLSFVGGSIGFAIDTNTISGQLKYIFTLTGSEDGTTDVEIPISSFNARRRSGDPTYLQIIIPGLDRESDINDRLNGDLKIDAAYFVGGSYTSRETILEANLEDIRIDKGPMNQSITLTGHKQTTYSNKSITLYNPIYKNTLNGVIRYRFAEPNLHLYPGDTVTVGSDTFVANVLSYFAMARVGGMSTQMEVSES